MMQPWERQTEETAKAWGAFKAYRDLPPGKRSLLGAARLVYSSVASKSLEKQCIPGHMSTWSKRHEWRKRAAAFDAAEDERKLTETAVIDRRIRIQARDGLLLGIRKQVGFLEGQGITPDETTRIVNSLRETLKLFELGELVAEVMLPPIDPSEYFAVLDPLARCDEGSH